MSKWKKIKDRILSRPDDLKIEEVASFLESLGYGKVSSKITDKMILINETESRLIIFNSNQGEIDGLSLESIINKLTEAGDL